MKRQMYNAWGGGGGERGRGKGMGDNLGGNCGMGVRASISKTTAFIYLAFDKNNNNKKQTKKKKKKNKKKTDPFTYLVV